MIDKLAEMPSVARGIKKLNFDFKKFEEKKPNLSPPGYPVPMMSAHKKIQPIRSSCLAGFWKHVNECLFIIKIKV